MSGRATQLDGLRVPAMFGVAWYHWMPPSWHWGLPWPIGIYYFYTLTGFLITAGLLRDRDRGETGQAAWRGRALWNFLCRRSLRILAPYYLAVAFAVLLPASDVLREPWWYLLHLSNWHFALSGWQPFTSHFWTLAVLQQFYLLWPAVVWLVPRRWLPATLLVIAAIGPVTRLCRPWLEHEFQVPLAITPAQADFLALGGLLALVLNHPPAMAMLRRAAWVGALVYAILFCLSRFTGFAPLSVSSLELTALALACCGLVGGGFRGFGGAFGKWLDSPLLQHLGRISYSFYLFHNFAPLMDWAIGFVGLGAWTRGGLGLFPRFAVLFAASWGVAWLVWRYVELPLGRLASAKHTPAK